MKKNKDFCRARGNGNGACSFWLQSGNLNRVC